MNSFLVLLISSSCIMLIKYFFNSISQYQDLTYAELAVASSAAQRKPQFSSATLGRPTRTNNEFKRHEPTIYAQVTHPERFNQNLIDAFF